MMIVFNKKENLKTLLLSKCLYESNFYRHRSLKVAVDLQEYLDIAVCILADS